MLETDTLFRVDGQVALVTGGMGRLGSQYVRTLAEAGAAVAVFDVAAPSETLASLVDTGRVAAHTVDIVDRAAVRAAMDQVVAQLGPATILVNNAGLGAPPNASAAENGPFEDYPEAS